MDDKRTITLPGAYVTPDTRASLKDTIKTSCGDTLDLDGHHDAFQIVLGVKTSETDGLELGQADISLDLPEIVKLYKILGAHLACAVLTMDEIMGTMEP